MPRPAQSVATLPLIAYRWLIGTLVVTLRYMWQTTVVHRSEVRDVDLTDIAPVLPPELVDDDILQSESGAGPIYHRRFRVAISDATLDARALMKRVVNDFEWFVPREVVGIRRPQRRGEPLGLGDDLVVHMPGPWNGPVRVVHVDETTLRFATRQGHLEAGQVQFSARDEGQDLAFEIEAWARPSGRMVRLLYSHLRLAKEVQLNMWVRFCRSALRASGGRGIRGIEVTTEVGR